MKTIKLFILIFSWLLLGCNTSIKKNESISEVHNEIEVDITNIINKDSLVLNGNTGIWSYNDQVYTGYGVKYHSNDTLKEKTGFLNGKKQGVYRMWHKNGVLKLESIYNQNVLEGTYKAWWNNGVLALEAHYIDGKKQGLESQWFMDGKISKKRNLLNDKEYGLQQAWLQNGNLYVNYEAKNGRIFGMRRANSCYELKDEVIVRNK